MPELRGVPGYAQVLLGRFGTEGGDHDLNDNWGRGVGVRGQPERREPGSLLSSMQSVSSVLRHLSSSKPWVTSRVRASLTSRCQPLPGLQAGKQLWDTLRNQDTSSGTRAHPQEAGDPGCSCWFSAVRWRPPTPVVPGDVALTLPWPCAHPTRLLPHSSGHRQPCPPYGGLVESPPSPHYPGPAAPLLLVGPRVGARTRLCCPLQLVLALHPLHSGFCAYRDAGRGGQR